LHGLHEATTCPWSSFFFPAGRPWICQTTDPGPRLSHGLYAAVTWKSRSDCARPARCN